tara:strand:- start:3683 stop:4006 length:324 start_codon:yes stop_codon:yes gene_type:complete
MEDNLTLIENNCGLKPIDQELIEIGSDPNFVFLNDPEFKTLRLFDVDGNIINVNSWIECAHYVNGGWLSTYNEGLSGNLLLLSIVAFATSSYLLLRYFKFNKKSYEK